MLVRINYTVRGISDYFDIEADTIQELREIAKTETDKRGLSEKENNLWSEKLKN